MAAAPLVSRLVHEATAGKARVRRETKRIFARAALVAAQLQRLGPALAASRSYFVALIAACRRLGARERSMLASGSRLAWQRFDEAIALRLPSMNVRLHHLRRSWRTYFVALFVTASRLAARERSTLASGSRRALERFDEAIALSLPSMKVRLHHLRRSSLAARVGLALLGVAIGWMVGH